MSEVIIPTVGGQTSALHIDSETPRILQYVAQLTQNDVNPPVATEIINDFGASPTYTYVSVGKYVGTIAGSGAFTDALVYSARYDQAILQKTAGSDPLGNSQVIAENGNADSFNVNTSEWFANQIAPFTIDQFPSNNVLRGQRLFIEMLATPVPTTVEEAFNVILSKLDVNQNKIWTQIVVRFGGTVTEVDGNKYRKSGYSTANKLIES